MRPAARRLHDPAAAPGRDHIVQHPIHRPHHRPRPPVQRRRTRPETIGAPDWHNDRAALLLDIEEALEHASDTTRAALIVRLRKAIPE